jgi:hypothetical protein
LIVTLLCPAVHEINRDQPADDQGECDFRETEAARDTGKAPAEKSPETGEDQCPNEAAGEIEKEKPAQVHPQQARCHGSGESEPVKKPNDEDRLSSVPPDKFLSFEEPVFSDKRQQPGRPGVPRPDPVAPSDPVK